MARHVHVYERIGWTGKARCVKPGCKVTRRLEDLVYYGDLPREQWPRLAVW